MQATFLPGDRAFLRYLEIPGDDPPLIWLHGWQCSSTGELLPVAVQPALRGRRSLLVDFLGHGYSDKPLDFAYSLEAHAGTIVALIDELGVMNCGLVGHSMGGGIAILVAAARPDVVSLLLLAEANIDADDADFSDQSEAEFVEHGFADLLAAQTAEAEAAPGSLRARHTGITRLIEPRALYREDASMARGTVPSGRELLERLAIPRWFLIGALSDDDDGLESELAAFDVGWRVVPDTGHPMGLQNPAGFAEVVAEVAGAAWGA